jgi:hypothetical protein
MNCACAVDLRGDTALVPLLRRQLLVAFNGSRAHPAHRVRNQMPHSNALQGTRGIAASYFADVSPRAPERGRQRRKVTLRVTLPAELHRKSERPQSVGMTMMRINRALLSSLLFVVGLAGTTVPPDAPVGRNIDT